MWVFCLGMNLYLAELEQESKINFVCIFFFIASRVNLESWGWKGNQDCQDTQWVPPSVNTPHSAELFTNSQVENFAIIKHSANAHTEWSFEAVISGQHLRLLTVNMSRFGLQIWTCCRFIEPLVFVREGSRSRSHLTQLADWFFILGQV